MASWTAAIYILTANFADVVLLADEDVMPLDGNPHPMPGHIPPPFPAWGVPPYPALGWNEGGLQHQPQQDQGNNDAAPEDYAGWPAWEAEAEAGAEVAAENEPVGAMPQQDQISIENNPSAGSSSSSDSEVVEVHAPFVEDHEPVYNV